jgi:hypothetical protein
MSWPIRNLGTHGVDIGSAALTSLRTGERPDTARNAHRVATDHAL